jgi:thiol-disulfide isomerase/thioredoxin
MRLIVIIIIINLSLLSCTAQNPAMVLEKSNSMKLGEIKPKKITNKQNLPTLLFYYADWCPYCNKMATIIEKAQQEFSGKLFFYFVDMDSDEGKKIASIYRPKSGGIPYMQFYNKNGDLESDVLGYIELEPLQKEINKIVN